MVGALDTGDVDAEEGVWEDGGAGEVAEAAADDEGGEEGEERVPAPGAGAVVDVGGPDDVVVVGVEVGYVLLEDLGGL